MAGIAWAEIARSRGYESVGGMMNDYYVNKGLSIHQLAQRFGCSVHAIREQLHKQNIAIKSQGGTQAKPSQLNTVTLEEYRRVGARALADKHGLDITTVYKHFRKRLGVAQRVDDGIPMRDPEI